MPGRRRKMPFMNRLSMDERQSIIGLLHLRWPERRIARETGFHRATIRRSPANSPRRKVYQKWPPTCHRRAVRASRIGASSRPRLPRAVTRSRSTRILVEHHGYDGAYNAVKRFVGKLRPAQPKVSCRFETDPGQEAQVDYGEGAFTRHPQTGKYRRPRLFAMKLSNSRRAFRRVVWESSSEIWSKLHEDALAKFGGAPANHPARQP